MKINKVKIMRRILIILVLFFTLGVKANNYRYTNLNTETLENEIEDTKSTDNKLSSIKIDNHILEDFNPDINEYDIEVDKDTDKVIIEAIKNDDKAVVGGDVGTKTLSYGINTFKIDVISEAGATNTYTLNITRIDDRSTVNTLKSITISDIDFIFSPNITEYDLDVNNKVDKIKITSELTDPKALYVKGFGNREEKLNEGSNKILIKVLSESGAEKVYTLNITRALSGNNTLKSLTVNDEKITIVEGEFIYHYEVETEVDEVVIKAIANDSKAIINLKDKYDLEVGENEIDVDIIAPDGSRASYILNITRKKLLSDNSRLTNIKIVGYKISFDPDKTLYNLRIKDEDDKLDIYTVPEDSFAEVEIEGNDKLVDGSIIKINVKAEDGTYTRYFINIEKSKKNTLIPIIIAIIFFSILAAICITMLIKRKKREDEKKKEIQEKIMEEGNKSDSLGDDINIEADDYETEENDNSEVIMNNIEEKSETPIEENIENNEQNKDIY